jgi:acetoin utilization deacetylase AcuC-like enzyme
VSLPFRLVYSPQYDLNLGAHVFPSRKYKMIHDRMLSEGFACPGDFVEPQPVSDDDVLLVHDRAWVDKLHEGTLTLHELMKLEIPYSHEMVRGFWLMAGGTLAAARGALERGIGFNIGGGFHHAFPSYGEGFCAIHDVAIAIRRLQKDGLIQSAMVVDTDVHHGNGTAAIFANDRSVLTLSIHQFNNYPSEKPASTIDIHLTDGVCDEEYLSRLRDALVVSVTGFKPDLIMHVAGADPFMEDQLGGLLLTLDGLYRRDRMIYELSKENGVPVAVTLAGGYSFNVQDTVTIHVNTAKAAADVWRPSTSSESSRKNQSPSGP